MTEASTSRIKSKVLKYILLCISAGLIFLAGVRPGWRMQSDFPNYWLGSKLLMERGDCDSLYDNQWFQDQLKAHGFSEQGKFAPFPPPTVFLFLPLTPFHPLEAKRVWMVVNLLLVFLAIRAFSTITLTHCPDAVGWIMITGQQNTGSDQQPIPWTGGCTTNTLSTKPGRIGI